MSNNNTNTQKTTFWKFLTDKTIEIPIIQRDYAQGREGKEHLRKKFLSDLKVALDKGEELKLDFVYGSKENNKLNPLDGQQRLTTLWLLHWYIALRSGRLTDANTTLNKFTYETRISSREFCKELCKTDNFDNYCFGNIVEYIKNQTWFYSAWKQDPTIQSMLRMLGGTKNEKGEPNNDGIEQVLNCSGCEITNNEKQCKYEKYWKLLAESDECPIIFYYLPLNEFKLTDDLYIKMNARGEQLTSFENFKADLIGYITKQKDNNELPEETKEKWGKLLDKKNGIPIKMDTDWTNMFWKNKSQDYKIDEIYFAFLNRFFFNELVCAKDIEKNGYLFAADGIEDNASFNLLYGEKSDDSSIKYEDFEKYRFYNKEIPIELFVSIKAVLDSLDRGIFNNAVINDCFPKWVDKKFLFFPTYQNSTITTLGQKERVVFLAVCRYFENGGYDETSFVQWMRVVWNIVENARVETVPSMIGAMRLVDELSKHSHGIYAFLSNTKSQINSDFAKDQVKEEIAKAKQIINGGDEWESKIIAAEKYAFFKGAIRFLFTKEDIGDDWEHFDTKWINAQEYFDKDGVKDGEENDELYNSNAILLKSLLANCDDFWHKIWWHFEFSNDANRWKRILTAGNWRNAVDAIMGTRVTTETTGESIDAISEPYIKSVVDDGLMDYVCNDMSGAWIRSTYHGYHAIWISGYPSDQIVLNPILARLKVDNAIEYSEKNKIENCRYYKCVEKNVGFKYGSHFFQWRGYPNEKQLDVYLMEDDWADYKKQQDPQIEGQPDNINYYCFKMTKEMETDTSLFTKQLDCLIAQAFPEQSDKACCNDCQNKICE